MACVVCIVIMRRLPDPVCLIALYVCLCMACMCMVMHVYMCVGICMHLHARMQLKLHAHTVLCEHVGLYRRMHVLMHS